MACENKRRKVLLVDDDSNVLLAARRILEKIGFEVTTASGGREVLSRLLENAFDLVITDNNMPEITGCEIARKIKHEDILPLCPVILMSGLTVTDNELGEAGVDVFLPKPFTYRDLLATINGLGML